MKTTICLNMIVKDESSIIESTLTNLLNYIKFDYWVIVDTGSRDNTIEIIQNFFNKQSIPGKIYKTPWKDFGFNRTDALKKAYNLTDYVFVWDADDSINGSFYLPNTLTEDLYRFTFGNPLSFKFTRCQLFNNRKKWKYVGVLHEFIECIDKSGPPKFIDGDYYFISGRTGARNKCPNKLLRDAEILEKVFYETQNDKDKYLHSRYAYYCGKSYSEVNNNKKALEFYKKTVELKGWTEEKYVSCMRIYDISEDKETALEYLIKSTKFNPNRIECIYRLICYYTNKKEPLKAYEYYTLIQDYYENIYYNRGIDTSCLSIIIYEYNFYLPYFMIIVSERLRKYSTAVKMYEMIFKYKYVSVTQFFVTHLISNLKFIYTHVNNQDFFRNMNIYVELLRKNNLEVNQDNIKIYNNYIEKL